MISKTLSNPLLCVLLLAACEKTEVEVGRVATEDGAAGNHDGAVAASQTGGAVTTITGTGGGQMAAGGTSGSGTFGDGDAGPDDALAYRWNLGSSCDVGVDAGPSQGTFNVAAPECPGVCIKPVQSSGVASADTVAYCTTSCSTDDDCVGAQRDPTDPDDKRCMSGYTCGVVFVKGPLCCRKVCVCRDFTGGPIPLPNGCANGGDLTCNLNQPG